MAESYTGGAYKEVYAHESWERTAKDYEQAFGAKLYDEEAARIAGHDALVRVSRLLVRYNRLWDAQDNMARTVKWDTEEAEIRYHKTLENIEEKKAELAELEKEGTLIEQDKQKKLDRLEEEKVEAHSKLQKSIAEAKKKSEIDFTAFLKTSLDKDDEGGILSSAMLGGVGMEGGNGYTLMSGGDDMDLRRGGAYVRDVIKGVNGGSFLDQMSILDTAVNTGVINLERGGNSATRSRSQAGATHGIREILEQINESDVDLMNKSRGEGSVDIDFDTLKKMKEDKTLDNAIGEKKEHQDLSEVAEKREDTPEAQYRRAGDLGDTYGMRVPDGYTGRKQFRPGFFRAIQKGRYAFSMPEDEKRNMFKVFFRKMGRAMVGNTAANRKAMFEDRYQAWMQRRKAKAKVPQPESEYTPNMEDDRGESVARHVRISQKKDLNLYKKADVDTGFLQTMERGWQGDDNEMGRAIFEASDKQNAARHMMNVYRLLGGKDNDLLNFRMALASYTIIAKQGTLYDAIKQSRDAGVVGNEDMSEPATMYSTMNPPGKEGIRSMMAGKQMPHETVFLRMVEEMQTAQQKKGAEATGPRVEDKQAQMVAGRLLRRQTGLQNFALFQMTGKEGNIKDVVNIDNYKQYAYLIEPATYAKLLQLDESINGDSVLAKELEVEEQRAVNFHELTSLRRQLRAAGDGEREKLQEEIANKEKILKSLPPKKQSRKKIQERIGAIRKEMKDLVGPINISIDAERQKQLTKEYEGSTPRTLSDEDIQKRVQIITRIATRLVADDVGTTDVKEILKSTGNAPDFQMQKSEAEKNAAGLAGQQPQFNPGKVNPEAEPKRQEGGPQPQLQPKHRVQDVDVIAEADEELEDAEEKKEEEAKQEMEPEEQNPVNIPVEEKVNEINKEVNEEEEAEQNGAGIKAEEKGPEPENIIEPPQVPVLNLQTNVQMGGMMENQPNLQGMNQGNQGGQKEAYTGQEKEEKLSPEDEQELEDLESGEFMKDLTEEEVADLQKKIQAELEEADKAQKAKVQQKALERKRKKGKK